MQRKGGLPGKIFARCVPERRFAGLFGCIARTSCQSQLILDTRRRYAATNWRFSRPRPLSGCMERKTCHGLPPGNASGRNLAIARRPGTHFTGILPSVSARNPGAAEQRELPELDRPAQETQPGGSAPVASWAASTASSSLGTATALCQHQPVACRPANNSVIADSASCRDSIHAAPAPPIRRAVRAQRRATVPACGACLLCSWQMRSAYKRQAEPLLRDYFVMVA